MEEDTKTLKKIAQELGFPLAELEQISNVVVYQLSDTEGQTIGVGAYREVKAGENTIVLFYNRRKAGESVEDEAIAAFLEDEEERGTICVLTYVNGKWEGGQGTMLLTGEGVEYSFEDRQVDQAEAQELVNKALQALIGPSDKDVRSIADEIKQLVSHQTP